MNKKTAITPTREQDFSEWYLQVIKAADLAEHSVVRGAMVIKPWGYALWENMQKNLDSAFKETGVQNAYFPLFIPLSFFEKESKHVEGFAKECAVVTHHRLEKTKEGKLTYAKDAELEEPLIVRPTSEMIIGHSFSKWIQSYRDLPLLINQWANVVRWEMRTRLFLRSSEFLWQEGHTAHATKEEAIQRAKQMLDVYVSFAQNILAIPSIKGIKTESEKFPGAEITYTFETMMQDGKALQGGTSHFLGQNFSKSCDIQFRDEQQKSQYAWTTSWGVTTRLIGALIMTHSDDDGLVLPPKIAPLHVVILPVAHKKEVEKQVFDHCDKFCKDLQAIDFNGAPIKAFVDKRPMRGGEKNWHWVKKGVPLRVEIGPKDIQEDALMIMQRLCAAEKTKIPRKQFLQEAPNLLEKMQKELFQKALQFQKEHTQSFEDPKALYNFFSSKQKKGFALCYFSEDEKIDEKLKKDLSITARCVPLDSQEKGVCIFTKKEAANKVVFAKAY